MKYTILNRVSNIMKKYYLILLTLLASPVIANTETLTIEISSGINIEMLQCLADKSNSISNKDFYISKSEITKALYRELIGENPSQKQSNNSPVENISNLDATEFCERLNEITSDTRPTGCEFRLPTENQLKYAFDISSNQTNSIQSGSGFRVVLIKNIEETSNLDKVEIEATPIKETASLPNPGIVSTEPTSIKPTLPASPKAGDKISIAVKSVKFPLICCPAGTFTMGSPNDEPCHTDKENQKQITFDKEFYIGKYEITQGQYVTVMGNNPSAEIGDKLPVHNVNWSDAQRFCEKLNELTEENRPEGTVFALPTEAQWEYACRSGYTTSLNNGKNLVNLNAEDHELNLLAWYESNSSAKIQTVGKKIANAWGIHDMHGNVWEWCSDKGADITMFGKQHSTRVIRGGSFKTKANECRSANHKEFREAPAQIDFGLRVVLIKQQ